MPSHLGICCGHSERGVTPPESSTLCLPESWRRFQKAAGPAGRSLPGLRVFTVNCDSNLLVHPVDEVLLRPERRHGHFLPVLEVLQRRVLGDVVSFCQGLVDGRIDSCKDTRALGQGRGQPCTTASDVVLAREGPRRPPRPPPCRSLALTAPPAASHAWAEEGGAFLSNPLTRLGGRGCLPVAGGPGAKRERAVASPRSHELAEVTKQGRACVPTVSPSPLTPLSAEGTFPWGHGSPSESPRSPGARLAGSHV